MTADERRWLQGRLRARIATRKLDHDTVQAAEHLVSDVNSLFEQLLAKRAKERPHSSPTSRVPGTPHSKVRVVITGVGIISAMGRSVEEYWENLVNGRSGVSLIEGYDLTEFRTKIASQIKNWDPSPWIEERESKRMS